MKKKTPPLLHWTGNPKSPDFDKLVPMTRKQEMEHYRKWKLELDESFMKLLRPILARAIERMRRRLLKKALEKSKP